MAMVVTMLEAEVAPERAGDLENAFARETAGPTPPGLVRSFLLHGPTWRIATVWESREALEAMRSSGRDPGRCADVPRGRRGARAVGLRGGGGVHRRLNPPRRSVRLR